MKFWKPREASPVKTMKDKEGRKKGKTYVKLWKPREANPVKTIKDKEGKRQGKKL